MARPIAFLLLLTIACPVSLAADDGAKPRKYATLLAAEADALIASAVRRPYGWGWTQAAPDAAPSPKKGKPQPIPIALDPGTTPTAGLVLLYAGELLGEPRFSEAAREVARGVVASQHRTGRFPNQASFGLTSAAGPELLTPLPDRGPTRAAMALLLSMSNQPEAQQEAIDRAGTRAALWLLKQQGESGGWPVLHPPGVAAKDSSRLVRLDTPDTRDSTFAMLLAYEKLGDPFQRRSVERALEYLLRARSGAALPIGPGLWQTAYGLAAMPVEKSEEFPSAYDTLASRYAAQTFLGVYTVLGEGPRLAVAELAVKSIDDLVEGDDGRWHRRYNFRRVALENAAAAASGAAPTPFGTGDKAVDEAPKTDPGLAMTSETVLEAKALGREKFRERLAASFDAKQQLAIVVAGLSDEPMAIDLPTAAEQVEPYLKRHADLFGAMDAPALDLAGRVKRLWALYLRARMEKQFGV
jgi:hypothetical protein